MRRRKSIRLKNFNYSSEGYYFVTICSYKRECLFGNLENGKMIFNQNGYVLNDIWLSLQNRFPVNLDAFQIMPNHMHMIVIINNDSNHKGRDDRAPTTGTGAPTTLGRIIAYFKYQTTKYINQSDVGAGIIPPDVIRKVWQRNFYERIVRNEDELYKIRKYIEDNPLNWILDKNNPINL